MLLSLSSLIIFFMFLLWTAEADRPVYNASQILRGVKDDNSTYSEPPPHESQNHSKEHNHANYIYTASLLLVAVPTVVGLSAAAVLVKRSFNPIAKEPMLTDMEEKKVEDQESGDEEDAKKTSPSPTADTIAENVKNKAFWIPSLSRGGTYARPKSFYVNIQREDSENFFELTLATPMEDNDETARGQQTGDKANAVYNLRI
eukprot:gene33067-40001_t